MCFNSLPIQFIHKCVLPQLPFYKVKASYQPAALIFAATSFLLVAMDQGWLECSSNLHIVASICATHVHTKINKYSVPLLAKLMESCSMCLLYQTSSLKFVISKILAGK